MAGPQKPDKTGNDLFTSQNSLPRFNYFTQLDHKASNILSQQRKESQGKEGKLNRPNQIASERYGISTQQQQLDMS